MPSLKCDECETRYRGCPHCLILVDVEEMYCTKCGRPLPSVLPLEESGEAATEPQKPAAGADADRLSRLEIGYNVPPPQDQAAPATPASLSPQTSANQPQPTPSAPAPNAAKGVVEDENDPLEQIAKHYPKEDWAHSPFSLEASVLPLYVFLRAAFTVVIAIFLLIYVIPLFNQIAIIDESEGINYSYIRQWANVIIIGVAAIVVIYTAIYFIVFFAKRKPKSRDAS